MGNEEGNEMNIVPQETVFENTLEAGSQMHTLLPLFESVGKRWHGRATNRQSWRPRS